MDESVLEYLNQLGLKPAKDIKESEDILYEAAEPKLVNNLIEYLIERANGKMDNKKFYNAKNATLNLSLALDGAYYYDIIQKICCWIKNSKNVFRGQILDIGCNCGIMSCFIAKTFPEAHVTGIDVCEKAIENAKELAQRLGLTNVSFKCQNIKTMGKESFDAIFSMHMISEIMDWEVNDLPYNFIDNANLYTESLLKYAKAIASKLKPEGHLVNLENIRVNQMLLGWMLALNKCKLDIEEESVETIESFNMEEEIQYQFFTAKKSKMSSEKMINNSLIIFEAMYRIIQNVSEPLYFGNEAKIMHFIKAEEMIEGYTVYDKKNKYAGEWSLWTHNEDSTGLILYRNINGTCVTEFHDLGDKYHITCQLKEAMKEINAEGFRFVKIKN